MTMMTTMVFAMTLTNVKALMIRLIWTMTALLMAVTHVKRGQLATTVMQIPSMMYLMLTVIVQVKLIYVMVQVIRMATAYVMQLMSVQVLMILLTMTTTVLLTVVTHVKRGRLVMMATRILKMMFLMKIATVQVPQFQSDQIAIISQLQLVQIALSLPI